MTEDLVSKIVARLSKRLYGSPLLTNVHRGELVEEICAMALESDWKHVGGDYGHCDLQHRSGGLEMQIKQSSARQSWGLSRSSPRFSIAHKTGKWIDGSTWVPGRSRNADLFLFAWHPLTDEQTDHRNPLQWEFYVLPEQSLPPHKSISLTSIRNMTDRASYPELAVRVQSAVALLGPRG